MKKSVRRTLAAKFFAILAATALPTHAGIPVIDGANLSQNLMTAFESVTQTLKQIQQYQVQLQQYEYQLKNTLQPSTRLWDDATTTMNHLRSAIDTLEYYQNNLGSIDAYLGRFKDMAAYRSSPCYSVNGCTAAEWQAMRTTEVFGSEAQKRANDSLFRGLKIQQQNLESDALQLQRLQSSAQGAEGQLQAIGYANQLASHQSNQLLQIRGLLIAQQNIIATRNQALSDNEAKQQAASDKRFAAPGPSDPTEDRWH
ncbi:P-type conjugative transfer protein TrbJ [Pseudoduganella flava]|uniref:P-type conjugative transfer protein TrbJ n=1 Tax=Pseudoduganella flava TaxID=871742 RepID=A0A562PNQ7_9BURK|nr:P-type conjugative transfer protein TrbJ [Pseudoduganella flava]QGZ40553.1 P-type conjugative transfer protein TrbJ [Pseudoduganella flava]TWI45998.1 P-type conjugative transfer protein TrbJ [Pseudoduganella flava]